MNDQENIRRIAKRETGAIKINVPLTDTVLSNLMKGKKYEWTLTKIINAESVNVLLKIYGFKGDKGVPKGKLGKSSRGGISKWRGT